MADVVRPFAIERRPHEVEGPRPLLRKVDAAEPYPVDALGALSSAARAIEQHTRAPVAICAQAVLGAVALVCQGHADVVLPTGQSRPTSLFLMTIAGSGDRKSAVDSLALQAISAHEQRLRDSYKAEAADYEIKKAFWTAERDQATAGLKTTGQKKIEAEADLRALGPEPQSPLTPILVCPEPTFEGYCKLTANGYPALGLFSAEGGSFVGGYGMSADQKLKTAASISSVWDGEPIKRVRAGDGSQVLAGRRLSVHLMAQPDVADLMLSDELLVNQGLLSRVLVAAPASTAGTRFFSPPSDTAARLLREYEDRLTVMLNAPVPLRENTRNELLPRRIELEHEAKAVWIEWYDYVETHLARDGELASVAGLANKAPEHAARLAAVMALYGDLNTSTIEAETIANSATLVRHYLNEALRLRAAARIHRDLRLAQAVWDWLQRQWREPAIYAAVIYNDCTIREVRDRKTALRIIRILEEHGYLIRAIERIRIGGSYRKEAWQIYGRSLA